MKKVKLFIGIDVSKQTIDVALLRYDQLKALPHKQFDNNIKGYKAMMKWTGSMYKCSKEEMLFCLEHTGIYSLNLCCYLNENNIGFWLESPLQIKRSVGIKRGKTDKLDAKDIANYAYTHKHKAKLYQMPGKTILTLKNLLAYRERLLKSKVSFQVSSNELQLCDKEIRASICAESAAIVKSFNEKIKNVEKQMDQLLQSEEVLKNLYKLTTSVKGIGLMIAAYMLIHTNAFTAFNDARQFACYCGIAPFEYASGTSIKGKTKVSHLANKKLKSLLNMAALNAVRFDSELKAYYERRVKEGKNKMCVLNIIRNKLVSRVFAVVNRGTPYVDVLKWAA
ncbi:MAG: IS110 family transposase [Bacteroidetes bacterium]|nr:IS110 family transposase [Bacteroidota bacterium]